MKQLLDKDFELATIQLVSMEVVRVELVPVDATAAVLTAFGESLCCLLKQFLVICPRRWQ